MLLALSLIVLAALVVGVILSERRHSKRNQDEADARSQEFHHITGARRWWKQPPGDPPEGDY